MIRDGRIEDNSLEPYVTPTDERVASLEAQIEARLEATVGHSSKNLLKITGNNQTVYGVEFVADATAGTITAYNESTSTSQNNSQYNFRGDRRELIEGSFLRDGLIFSCEGLVAYAICAIAYYNDSNTFISDQQLTVSAPSKIISIPSGATKFRFYVRKRKEVGSAAVVFAPMLREASISDDTFEPYVTPTDEKKQDKPVVLWEGDVTTNLTVNVGDNSYYSHYILTGISSVKVDSYAERTDPAFFTVIIHSDMPGNYYAPYNDIYAILTISYQSSQGVTNMVIDNPKKITLNKIIGIPE